MARTVALAGLIVCIGPWAQSPGWAAQVGHWTFASLSFGNVAQAGLAEPFLLDDLTVVGSLAGGGDLGPVDLIYVPEPSTLLLVAWGLMLAVCRPLGKRM